MKSIMWFAVSLLVIGQVVRGEDTNLKNVLIPYYAREAAKYEFFLDRKHEQRLELSKPPVMTWTNGDQFMGAVFVWTYGGRPEVIGCIGSRQAKPDQSIVFHEFHSLSLQPLEPVPLGRGKQKWAPSGPGVKMTAVEGADRPSDSERLRLTQMRNIAREFGGWMQDGKDITELRLLPQPIFRYQAPERGVVDGAIFAFVWKGTDPEILLILENRKGKSENAWHSAMARFNYRELWVKRNDIDVWRVGIERQNDVYITGEVGEIDPTELPTASTPTGK